MTESWQINQALLGMNPLTRRAVIEEGYSHQPKKNSKSKPL